MAPRQLLMITFLLLALVSVIFLNQQEDLNPSSSDTTAKLVQKKRVTASNQNIKPQKNPVTFIQPMSQMTPRNAFSIQVQKKHYQADIYNREVVEAVFLADNPWKVLMGVSAIPKRNGPPLDSKIIGEINGYFLVDGVNLDLKNFSQQRPVVVIDPRRNSVGVVTGVFTVVLKSETSKNLLLENQNLKILNSFPEINTYFVTAAHQPFDIEEFQLFLKNEFEAESVKAEVLSRQYEKN